MSNETDPNDDDKPKVLKLRGFPGRSKEPNKAEKWVSAIYEKLPKNPLDNRQVAMVFGEGEDQQIALFELKPSMTDPNAAYIEWFQAYPQKQGVGTKAMSRLQDLAKAAGIKLILTSWKHGKVPERVLNRFYKGMGFKPGKSREGMIWDPSVDEAADSGNKLETMFGEMQRSRYDADDDYADPRKRKKITRANPLKYDPVIKDVKYDPDDDGIREPSVTKNVNGLGLFIMTGHFRDRLRQRKIDPADALGLIERVFKEKFHKVQNIPYGIEALIIDDRSTLGIIMLKEPGKPTPRYIFKTAHPKYTKYSHRYVIRESDDLNKPTPGIEELAVKYNVSVHDVLRELKNGVEVETEHTDKLHVAREIAMDHLGEDLYYYVKMAKAKAGDQSQVNLDENSDEHDEYLERLMIHLKSYLLDRQYDQSIELIQEICYMDDVPDRLKELLDSNKNGLLRRLLQFIKYSTTGNYLSPNLAGVDAETVVDGLRKLGINWPELNAIGKSVKRR